MAELADFLPLMRGKLPGCPNPLMKEGVLEASIEFCKRARLILNDTTVKTKADRRFYYVYPPDGLSWKIESVLRDDDPLIEGSRRLFRLEGLDVETGDPTHYYQEGDGRLVLGPIPESVETLNLQVVAYPEDGATEVPDRLHEEWRREIAAGAKAYIREHYTTWADDNEQAKEMNVFEEAINKAISRLAKGGTNRRLRSVSYFY